MYEILVYLRKIVKAKHFVHFQASINTVYASNAAEAPQATFILQKSLPETSQLMRKKVKQNPIKSTESKQMTAIYGNKKKNIFTKLMLIFSMELKKKK